MMNQTHISDKWNSYNLRKIDGIVFEFLRKLHCTEVFDLYAGFSEWLGFVIKRVSKLTTGQSEPLHVGASDKVNTGHQTKV